MEKKTLFGICIILLIINTASAWGASRGDVCASTPFTSNMGVPASCLNTGVLQIKINTTINVNGSTTIYTYCYNSTSWVPMNYVQSTCLLADPNTPASIFEESVTYTSAIYDTVPVITPSTNFSYLLMEGKYYYDLTIYDKAGDYGYYDPNITIDTIPPTIVYLNVTSLYTTRPYIEVSVYANDTNINTTTIRLYNSTNALINTTSTNINGNYSINFTNLNNGTYYYNATTTDLAGHTTNLNTLNTTILTSFQSQYYTINFPYPNNAYTNNPILTYGFTTTDPHYDYTIYNNTGIVGTRYCFQESANVINQTGIDGNCRLNYTGTIDEAVDLIFEDPHPEYAYDGNYGTYMQPFIYTVTYIKPPEATPNSLIQISDNNGIGNVSIPADCWAYSSKNLTISTGSRDIYPTVWFCKNSTGWHPITGSTVIQVFEEAIYWQIPNNLLQTTNTSRTLNLADGRYYYDLSIYDKAGNLGYYDPNITIDTIPPSISFTSNSTQNNSVLVIPNIFIQVAVNDTNINYTEINLYGDDSDDLCYQEQANISTVCGGLGTGDYNLTGYATTPNTLLGIDADFNTCVAADASNYNYYITYYKPANATNVIWRVKDGAAEVNIDLPNDCYNYYPDKILLYRKQWTDSLVFDRRSWQCYNGSWNIVRNVDVNMCEEGVYWHIPNVNVTLINTTLFYGNGVHSVNYTNISDGIYYFNATAYDNATNYNTTPTWYTIMDAVKDNLSVTAHEIITNNTVSYNITFYINNTYYTSIPSTGETTTFSILYNNYSSVQVLSNGYVGCDYGSWNATNNYVFPTCEFTNHQLNITMYNSYTNAFINNITSIITMGTYNYTNTQYTINGHITHNVAQGLSYNITLAPPEYLNRTIEYNATGTTASRNLSANQSIITINFLHAISGELINNANITMNDTLYTGKVFNTTTGIIIFTPNTGVHNLTITIPRYTNTRYTLTVANQDVRTINITLFPILNLSLYDEKASAINLTYFNFSKPNQMKYTLFCEDDTTIQYIIPNNTAMGPYNINSTCDFGKIRFDLQYNNIDGSTTLYHRILVLPATINLFDFKVFIPELSTTTIVQTFLKPYDIFGIYTIEADTQVRVTKLMPSGVELMIADYMDAEGKITAYLIQGDSYIITILANGVPAKILGPYNADTEGTKILRLFDVVLVSNATMKEGTTTATSQFYELSTNQSLLTLSYRDYANYTQSLTMTVYNGSCDDIENMLISSTLDYEDLNTSGYDADLSWNVLGSRYMNHSSNIQFCAIHNVTYWDGTTASRRVSHVYDSWIPRPGQFDNPWTFPWIVMLVLVVIALGLNARTVSFGSLLIVALAAILYAWNWVSTGAPGVLSSVIVGVSLLIAIMFALKRNVT